MIRDGYRNWKESPDLTSEQAKEYLLKTVEEDVKLDTAKLDQRAGTAEPRKRQDKKAKEYVVTAIQKCAADHVSRDNHFGCPASE